VNKHVTNEALQIGVDVGGTFTDFLLVDPDGRVHIGKHLTTGEDPSQGVVEGSEKVLADAGHSLGELDRFVHGTTVATNTLLTRRGAKVGMLTTKGFRDTVDIMEKVKYDIYDLLIEYPEPLVPRQLRREIAERVRMDGTVLQAPSDDEIHKAVDELVAAGAEAIVVCFLHSYKYPKHEQDAMRAIRKRHNDLIVGCSSEICPDIGEFMRFSTASINMYIRPRMERYLSQLESSLTKRGLKTECRMMLSTGATADFKAASELPIRLIESGPAAGAIAAAHYGKLTGIANLIAFDMGGTTAKACVIDDGKPAINHDHFEVARVHRFKKGSGLPLKAPSIDMIEIGAGGGSIAHADEIGLLKVGPESAESNPGPACYSLGGEQPTVTDANLLLGYLDGGFFLGGKMKLDPKKAEQAIANLASTMKLDTVRAAWGIHEVVSESMASAARTHLLEKGRDVRKYALFAFGGSGPVHACRVAENLAIDTVICALGAGTLSALGLLLAPMAFDFVQTDVSLLETCDMQAASRFYAEAEERGRKLLQACGVADSEVEISRYAELRYAGQGYEVGIRLPSDLPMDDKAKTGVAELFAEEYARLYGNSDPDNQLELVNWRLVANGPAGNVNLHTQAVASENKEDPLKGTRSVYFPGLGYSDVPVYDRYALQKDVVLQGPAIVEERESTAVIAPGWVGKIDSLRNLVIRRQRA
jgi:N-methylhydantoinase A/oxoprolinase/acetone carboxylase beta subunit